MMYVLLQADSHRRLMYLGPLKAPVKPVGGHGSMEKGLGTRGNEKKRHMGEFLIIY